MADQEAKSLQLLKSTRVTVFVDEALDDMLVVTYEFGLKIFKGILLDFTKKRNLPYGISTLNPALAPPPKTNLDDDSLYSANQRFAYTDPNHPKPKNVRLPAKYKNSKMTVRLRPRQVLCSKCKGICNENSENVSKKRKSQETIQIVPAKRSADAPITRSVYSEQLGRRNNIQKQKLAPSLIPKISRLQPHEINKALNGDLNEFAQKNPEDNKPNLRKKRDSKENPASCTSTRTIKISFGPQGKGTVLKIPAPIDDFASDENTADSNKDKSEDRKAARRALKRAKKKARLLAGHSPAMSPRYQTGGISPRYSPRYLPPEMPKRHKHKLKRKRKHKDDRNCSKGPAANSTETAQKLSISLKRLQDAYVAGNAASDKEDESISSSDEFNERVPNFPQPPHSPLILRINAQSVCSAFGADGNRLLTGDIVWGKIQGFPWWPGKITSVITENQIPQADVSWYGSPKSSRIKCDHVSQFLDNFKVHYNKKRRGPYKEAVRQATVDAKENAGTQLRKDTIMNSPSQSILNVPPQTLASPREIDVMS